MTTTIDWGGDLNDLPDGDMDPLGRDLDGTDVEVVKQALFRRFTTERGGLWYDLTYGENLRSFLSEASTPEGRVRIQARLVEQALLDERIDAADALVAYNDATEEALITLNCYGALGPFALVMKITDVSIERLHQAA